MKAQHLSKKEVEHVAWLAHIELSDQEKALFTEQFNEILDYFKKIDMVDTEGVEPTYHVLDLKNVSPKRRNQAFIIHRGSPKERPKKGKKIP